MSNNPTLIAGFENFLSYIRNQDVIIKTLRDQQVQHQKADEQIKKLTKELVALKDAEIEKLKKKNEELREEIKYSTLLTAEVVQDQCPEELKHLCTDEKAQEICDKYKEGVASYLYQVLDDTCEADIDYEDELYESDDEDDDADKYDGDDWGWVYGKNIVEQEEYKEVVLVMAGGGDHWENYTMTPTMNYIVNKDGKHPQRDKVLVQSSCGKYVSFQDKDYECEGDEIICEYENCVVE